MTCCWCALVVVLASSFAFDVFFAQLSTSAFAPLARRPALMEPPSRTAEESAQRCASTGSAGLLAHLFVLLSVVCVALLCCSFVCCVSAYAGHVPLRVVGDCRSCAHVQSLLEDWDEPSATPAAPAAVSAPAVAPSAPAGGIDLMAVRARMSFFQPAA